MIAEKIYLHHKVVTYVHGRFLTIVPVLHRVYAWCIYVNNRFSGT